jgi:hypothetical protein
MANGGDDISPEVSAFIADYVGSVVQLETLLLLHGAPDREWTADDVAATLRVDRNWADAQLDAICHQGLAECREAAPVPHYRYAPRTAQLRAAIDALAKTYAERRVTVIGLIFAKPVDSLRAFSEAFRLRKDKDNPHG